MIDHQLEDKKSHEDSEMGTQEEVWTNPFSSKDFGTAAKTNTLR